MNKALVKTHMSHLGTIFYNYSIFCFVMTCLSFFSVVLIVTFWVLLIAIGLLSLCVLFFVPGYTDLFTKPSGFMEIALMLTPIFAGVGIAFSVLSLIFLLFDRQNPKNKNKIIISAVLVGILIFVLIYTLIKMKDGNVQ